MHQHHETLVLSFKQFMEGTLLIGAAKHSGPSEEASRAPDLVL